MSRASDRRKSGGEGGGGGANWMDTYGDLVTLLLTFFVLLFSFSSIDAAKWEALVGALTGTRVTIIEPLTPDAVREKPIERLSTKQKSEDDMSDPGEMEPIDPSKVDQALWELYQYMLAYIEKNNIEAEINLIAEEYSIILRFSERVFFKSGDATVLPESLPVLDDVIQLFAEIDERYSKLSIEGHTDNVPINTVQYPSNWELSIDRARSVQRYIMGTGLIDPRRIKIGGYGEYDPLDTNDTPEGRAKNRRVDFVVEGKRPQ